MESGLIGRIPPHSLEAEQSVLGAMILDKEAINTAIEIIRPDDFYKEANKEIFEAILILFNKNEPVDLITLSEELKRRGTLENIGGVTYLANLSSGVATTANVKYYCKIVEEKSILRRLIRSCDDVIAKSYENSDEVNAIIENAEKAIFDITQGRHREGFSPLNEVLLSSFSQIEERAANQGTLTGLTTGFIDLDNKLSGLQKSDLILLAARPSMGKTAISVNIVTNAALKANAKVAVFSLEMSKEQLVQRMISATAHVDLQKIISGRLSEEEWIQVINAMGPLSQAEIFIDDTAGISLMEMKAKCRRLKIEKGLDLVMIDYLQLMQLDGRQESRQQEISAISRGLKALAKEMECPVIALSQLSRAPELRTDHRPILSDLRESGAIEQDADVVLFLYRDEYYHEDSEKKNIGEVIIAKHRNGPTGSLELVFKKEFTKFVNMARE
ncbi:replicative DNA helicase [Tissierella praeacuta]|uniref:Replicative DNA helicase n=1 Tax=Tissierella praeacuta DSM 18095 TaxID=1123404 RepID=A0A1M4Y3E2_9FIRM|nr:replicative DNA helicase [Tissierella praeacuta]TCU79491.1 primary replicative DNA helicase [Tissierella praeacuta]SHF00218.1 primary replicative DNA helicase [Tissierella praeacuta DSM 18095]SUO98878.1 Replicative DNA helicase [Tissierella praeacuta]